MKIRFRNIMAVCLMLLLVMALTAPASAAYNVKKVWARFSATAGETLATGNVVCIKDADGYAYKADSDASTLRPAVGIIGKGGASGDTVEIIVVGQLNGWSSLSEGAWAYLSTTAGAVTQSAPTYAQIVGKAVSTTDYFFNFSNYLDTSSLTSLGTLTGATPIIGEGASDDDYEWTFAPEDPTTDNTYVPPDIGGAVPVIIAQGYTQTSNGDAAAADVTGSSITLADGWFSEGRTLRVTLGGTVTGSNGTISVGLYFEDGAVMTLTTADDAAGDWTAEFIIVGVSGTAQRIVGVLRAEAGAEVITDYAADTTNISSAGTIPVKAQITLADGSDVITNEYVLIECWSKTD